eukprot:5791037-Pyramimonas_sp.AAC.1
MPTAPGWRAMSSWHFYRNRLARVVPVYYLANLLAVPLIYLGQAAIAPWQTASALAPTAKTAAAC